LGTVQSFITPGAPTVSTLPATAITGTSATFNASANPNNAVGTGWFRYGLTNPGTCNDTFGTRAPTTAGSALGGGAAVVNFSQSVLGLTPGTTYFFCALASNVVGLVVGTVETFRTPAAPIVMTSSASNVLGGLATLNGGATPNGANATGWFRYGPVDPGACNDTFGTRAPGSSGTALGSGLTVQSYSQNISGLAPGVTYFFCAIASNLVGTSFGPVLSFSVEALPPLVTTLPGTDLTTHEATLNGSANPKGSAATGWFRYSTTMPASCDDVFGTRVPATGGTALGMGTVDASWSVALTGLKPGLTYYVCAMASNVGGASFGGVVTFETAKTTPTARTAAAEVGLNGDVTLNGGANSNGMVGKAWFQIGRDRPIVCTADFGEKVPPEGFPLSDSESEVPLTHLIPGATGTFYYCAVAETAGGTAYGEVQSFTVDGAKTAGCGCGVGSESASLLAFGLVLVLRARRRRS
jgi:MYXO-CTERM domain-containing protein